MGNVVWKVMAIASGVVASKVAKKATNSGWKATTGQAAPVNKHDPNYSAKQTALFMLISTAAAGAVKAFAERKAADYYTKSAGHPPKAVVKQQQKAVEKSA
ncbi:DUF4235 domain-containing protein [Calidifontibacter terrae]